MDMQAVYSRIDALREEMTAELAAAVRIPSVMGRPQPEAPYGEGPRQMLEYFLARAAALGFPARSAGSHMGVIDFGPQPPALGILCHLDVVPAGEGWSYPPFGAEIHGTRMYGRGTSDNKGPAVSVLYALRALAGCGIVLSRGVRLLVGCNEENGSHDLAWYRVREALPPMLFTPDGFYPCINTEKGRYVPVFGFSRPVKNGRLLSVSGSQAVNAIARDARALLRELPAGTVQAAAALLPEGFTAQVQDDGAAVSLTVTGRAAHASRPELALNPLPVLLDVLCRLPLTGEELNRLGALRRLFPAGHFNGQELGLDCRDELSGDLTCALTMLDWQDGVCSARCDIRFPVSRTLSEVTAQFVHAASRSGVELLGCIDAQEGHHTPPATPLVRTLLQVYGDHTGRDSTPLSMGGGTYVHGIDGAVAFGVCYLGEDCNAHRADEYVELDTLTQNAKIFADAIVRLCT